MVGYNLQENNAFRRLLLFSTCGQLKDFDMLGEITSSLFMTIFSLVHGSLFHRSQQQTGTGRRICFSWRVELKFYPVA